VFSSKNQAHQLELVAFHESGHAVVHNFYGHPVVSVEIGGGTGRCTLPEKFQVTWGDDESEELFRREATMQLVTGLCAGRSAMRRCHGGEHYRDHGWKNSEDRKCAMALCVKLSDGDKTEADLLLALLSHRASKLVEQHWESITRLSFELLEHYRLCGEQVAAILNGSNGQA